MFEQASRMRLRFAYKGERAVEDLWSIPLGGLDALHGEYVRARKAMNEDSESLLGNKSTSDDAKVLDLKIAIIRHVVQTRLNEMKAREQENEKAARKTKLRELLAEKKDEALKSMTAEQIEELLSKM